MKILKRLLFVLLYGMFSIIAVIAGIVLIIFTPLLYIIDALYWIVTGKYPKFNTVGYKCIKVFDGIPDYLKEKLL